MLPDRVSNPGPLTYESGALPIALRGPAQLILCYSSISNIITYATSYRIKESAAAIPKCFVALHVKNV